MGFDTSEVVVISINYKCCTDHLKFSFPKINIDLFLLYTAATEHFKPNEPPLYPLEKNVM